MYIPGIPTHVVQRGHNRNACFFRDADFYYYKRVLAEGMSRYGVVLHAYCLMTNHVHLLMTPAEEDSISRTIQYVGRQYVQYVNKTYRRSGTLWEGRHKGSVVDAENYLLSCYRYIELNPVAASMVEKPEHYPWSSYHFNAIGKPDALVTPHAIYRQLSEQGDQRRFRYRQLFRDSLTDADTREIKSCLSANQALGKDRFKDQVASTLGRKLGQVRRGRPRMEGRSD